MTKKTKSENVNEATQDAAPAQPEGSNDNDGAELDKAADTLLSNVPEHLRALIPSGVTAGQQIAWFNTAKASGAFDSKANVPATDGGQAPAINTPSPDLSSLPAYARIAAGYRK